MKCEEQSLAQAILASQESGATSLHQRINMARQRALLFLGEVTDRIKIFFSIFQENKLTLETDTLCAELGSGLELWRR